MRAMNVLSVTAFLLVLALVLLGKGFVAAALAVGAAVFVVPVAYFGWHLLFAPSAD